MKKQAKRVSWVSLNLTGSSDNVHFNPPRPRPNRARFFYARKKMEKPKNKKHNWGRFFVITPRATEAEVLSGDRSRRIKSVMTSKTGRKNGE